MGGGKPEQTQKARINMKLVISNQDFLAEEGRYVAFILNERNAPIAICHFDSYKVCDNIYNCYVGNSLVGSYATNFFDSFKLEVK